MVELPTLSTGEMVAAGALAAGVAGLAVAATVAHNRSSSRKRRKSSYSRSRSRVHRSRKRYTPRTAGKGRDRSSRRIRYTKKGQPYVIQRNGRARFIKMSSARRSHRQKGGRY